MQEKGIKLKDIKEENNSTMPDLRGLSYENGLKFIKNNQLNLRHINYSESKYARNTIIEQSINPGSYFKNGDNIDLTLSNISLIRFLPDIYNSLDEENNEFLKRYLWIFQHIFNGINIKLDDLHKYFNPMVAPRDFFHWLASWFSINVNYAIPEDKMRLLVKEAVTLYQWRGTSIGLAKFLEIITGVKPDIIDNYIPISEYSIMKDKLIEREIIEEDTSISHFTVSFPVTSDYFDVETIKKINQIIKLERPAHTKYYITFKPKERKKKETKFIIGDMVSGEI
jgi:phage tail-like protein